MTPIVTRDIGFARPSDLAFDGERHYKLSRRELQILKMIATGESNRQIACRLKLSQNTISVHRTNIMNTLDIHKSTQLVIYAIKVGLIDIY